MRVFIPQTDENGEINRNMGCIEIELHEKILQCNRKINRNMGCIEIMLSPCTK